MQEFENVVPKRSGGLNRRSFLSATGLVAAATFTGALPVSAIAEQSTQAHVSGRRKLGSLEVSSVGLGVQNMSRSYETTRAVPPGDDQYHPRSL